MKKRSTQITVETERLLVISRPGGAARAWCAMCEEQVQMLKPEEAARLTGVNTRTIYRRVEAGQLHGDEAPEGSLLICLNSLAGDRMALVDADEDK